jgi:hypothetical protein
MAENVIKFLPRELGIERTEAVRDDRAAMQRVVVLAERAANIVNETGKKITEADRQSLLWHLSLIRELAVAPGSKRGIVPLCSLPRFDPPPGAA